MTRLDLARLGVEIEPKSLVPNRHRVRDQSIAEADPESDGVGRDPGLDDQLLTPREVANLFGVRTTTIARWARDGKLPHFITPGGHRRYRRADAYALLDETELGSPDEDRGRLIDDAVRLYAQGWSIRQVAERFDCSYGAMRRILLRHTVLRGRGTT